MMLSEVSHNLGTSPDQVCLLLEDKGYRAKLSRASQTIAYLESAAAGLSFGIAFIYLSNASTYKNIIFQALLPQDGVSEVLDYTNEFNQRSLCARAYTDEAGDVSIRWSTMLEQSRTPLALLDEFFEFWLSDIELWIELARRSRN